MSKIFLKIFELSITAIFIIAIILIIRVFLNKFKMPKWISYALWGILLFRLICPFSIPSDVSIFGLFENQNTENISIESSYLEYENNLIIPDFTGSEDKKSYNNDVKIENNKNGISYVNILSYIWILGMISVIIYSIIMYIRLKIKLSNAEKINENIYELKYIYSPFVAGIVKPKIYLPVGMDKINKSYVIEHEKIHINRGDHIIKFFSFIIISIYWFNPFMWLAYRLMSYDMEMSCDEKVTKKYSKTQKAQYAMALIELAKRSKTFLASPIAFGENKIKGRVRNIIKSKKYSTIIILVVIIAVVVAAFSLITDPFEKIEVPKAKEIEVFYIEEINDNEYDSKKVLNDQEIINNILEELESAKKTGEKSLSDIPSESNYYKLEISTENELYTFYIYKDLRKTYVERPYMGIYKANQELVDKLDDIYTEIEKDKSKVTDKSYEIIKVGDSDNEIFSKKLVSENEIELADNIIFDYMIKSAAWPGNDIDKLEEYYILRVTYNDTNEIFEHYIYLLEDGTSVLQRGANGRYSAIDKNLYNQLEKYDDIISSTNETNRSSFIWSINFALSSVYPAIPINVDIEADEIVVSVDSGTLYLHDTDSSPNYINCGHNCVYDIGENILWSPLKYDYFNADDLATEAVLKIEIINKKKTIGQCNVKIKKIENQKEDSINNEYEVTLEKNKYDYIMSKVKAVYGTNLTIKQMKQ